MRNLLAVLSIFLLSGCIGDGGFSVAGTVQSSSREPLQNCKLQLGVDAPDLNTYYTRSFNPPQFRENFTVAPSKATYPLTILCSGHEPHVATINYGSELGAGQAADLGLITLRRNADGR